MEKLELHEHVHVASGRASPPAQAEVWMATMMTNNQYPDDVRIWTAEQNGVGKAMHEATPHPSLDFPVSLGIGADTADRRIDL